MTEAAAQGSIRRRLLLLLLCGAAAIALLIYVVVNSVARQIAQESQDNVLVASALSILDSARSAGGAISVDMPYAALSMLDTVTDERVFYAIWLGPEFLSGYADLPRAPLGQAGQTRYLSTEYLGEAVRVASVQRPFSSDDGRTFLDVSVAQTLSGQRATLARMSQTALILGAGIFLVTALFAVIVARNTLQPLDRLAVSVARRGPKDLRPVAAPVPQEMVPLVSALNVFMQRLSHSLARSEDFIAEAAHRVRTPLAVVRTKAEIIERRIKRPENRKAMREMIRAIDDSSRTAGQLLDHAMVAFRLDDMQRETVDLAAMLRETVARLTPLFDVKDIGIEIGEAAELTVLGDRILIQNALHNLLDNALKYSPAGAQVRVSLSVAQDGRPTLAVRDTGPGFTDADPQLLTERFTRGAQTQSVIGSGLGLTIAKDVIEAHGGALALRNRAGGGACACLHFPSA